jgi:hypothetical protein
MMNWIYNWYDPRGKLSVSQLVDNITRLFLTGFLSQVERATVQVDSEQAVNIWRSA